MGVRYRFVRHDDAVVLEFWVLGSGSQVRDAVDRDVVTWVLGSGGPVRMGSGFWVLGVWLGRVLGSLQVDVEKKVERCNGSVELFRFMSEASQQDWRFLIPRRLFDLYETLP